MLWNSPLAHLPPAVEPRKGHALRASVHKRSGRAWLILGVGSKSNGCHGEGSEQEGPEEASGLHLLSVAAVPTRVFNLWDVTELHFMVCVPFP